MTVGDFDWNTLIVCGNEGWLLKVSDALLVGMEEGNVVNDVCGMVKLSWQALTVEKSELVILQLNLGRVCVH